MRKFKEQNKSVSFQTKQRKKLKRESLKFPMNIINGKYHQNDPLITLKVFFGK